jgi:hypothetical protein
VPGLLVEGSHEKTIGLMLIDERQMQISIDIEPQQTTSYSFKPLKA